MLQKSWVLTSITLLGMTSAVPSVNVVVAETIQETETSEGESLKLPHENLLESLDLEGAATESEEANVEEGPTFSFKQEEMSGTVGKITAVIILVDQPINQVEVTIPQELTVELEELSEEIEATQMNEQEWWFTAEDRTEFTLPISAETAGKHTLRVEDEIDGTIVFLEEPSEQPENGETDKNRESEDLLTPELEGIEEPMELPEDEEPAEDNERDTNNDQEDLLTPEIQEEVEAPSQESEEIAPATTSNVSTWAQFRTAINTNSVTVINVNANISGNTSLSDITRNLTINGNGFTINTQSQNIQIGRGSRTLRVNDVTFTNSLGSGASQIRSRYENTGATIILSNIRYNSIRRLVGSAINYTGFHVIFDGGISRVSGGGDAAIMTANTVTLRNNAVVIAENKRFYDNVTTVSASHANSQRVQIDEGSQLSISGSVLRAATITVNGDLFVTNTGAVIQQGSQQTGMNTINIGSNASVALRRTTAGAVIASTVNNRIVIENGAEFDLYTHPNSGVLNDAANRTTELILEAHRVAFWNQGIANDNNSLPSNNFRDLQFRVTGRNGSILNSTNNSLFSSIYSQQGLAGYSRIKTEGKREGNPLDPLEPDKEIDPENPPYIPENQGDFRIDFVSQFNFGIQEKERFEEKKYYALPQYILDVNEEILENEPRPNYIQITDNRADTDGWQLAVRQKEQFQTEKGSELSGASLQLMNRQLVANHDGQPPREATTDEKIVLEPGVKQPLLSSSSGEGKGTWIYRFGDGDSANRSIALVVPKETIPQVTTYQTILDWELQAVPDNN